MADMMPMGAPMALGAPAPSGRPMPAPAQPMPSGAQGGASELTRRMADAQLSEEEVELFKRFMTNRALFEVLVRVFPEIASSLMQQGAPMR